MKQVLKKTAVKKTVSVLYCLFFINWLLAQQVTDQWRQTMQLPGNNYFEIKAQAEAYFEAHPELVGQQGTGWKDYQRYKWFMEPRVDINGSLATANAALIDWFQNQTNYCPSSSLASNWSLLGPVTTPPAIGSSTGISPTGMGIIESLYIKPSNPNIMYAGSNTSGLWKTINGGQTWTHLTSFTGNKLPGLGVLAIAVHPGNDDIIYIATGSTGAGRKYGMGILKTTDGGATWSIIGPTSIIPSDEVVVSAMAMHPTTPDVLYATTAKQTGWCCGGVHVYETRIYKTIDAGSSWTELDIIPSSRFWDIEFKPGDPNTVLIGGESLWRTTDGGANWTDLTLNMQLSQGSVPGRIALSFTGSANPNQVFLLYALFNAPTAGIMRSDNSGITWTLINTYTTSSGPLYGASSFKCELIVSPSNPNILYTGAIRMAKSFDGGNTLTTISNPDPTSAQYKHDDIRELQIVTISGNERVYTGNDGGVGVSTTGGSSWTNVTGSGLSITQFYGIGGFDGGPVGGGCQDVSTMIYRNNSWGNTSSLYCDGGDILIDYSNPDRLYCNCNGGLRISTDGGANFQNPGKAVGTIEIHPTNPQILWTGTDNIYKSLNGGIANSWSPISNKTGLGNKSITALAVAPSNLDVIYFSAGGATWNPPVEKVFFKTTDGGTNDVTSWTDISANVVVDGLSVLQWFGITNMVIHPTNPDKIWISLGGFGGSLFDPTYRVCYSSDGGATWSNLSTGLPGLPVSKLIYQKGTNDVLYAGTDVGVFVLNPSSNQWECFSTNLPAAIVSDLEIDYCSGKLRAGTYGWGIWESSLAITSTFNYSSFQTKIINSNTTFATSIYLNSNLSVQNNSTLTVTNLFMPQQSKIIVQQGCSLIVQNTIASRCSGDFWDGIIEVQPGGTLVLGNNSLVKLKDNGKIIIDKSSQSGQLFINPGASITLKDNNTLLEITGNLTAAPNATFTFTGNGYINWKSGNSTSFGANSQFKLNGSGKTDLLMKLEPNAVVDMQGVKIDVRNGKIEYNSASSFYANNSDVLFQNINFTGSNTATGFYGEALQRLIFNTSEVNNLNTGIKLENISAAQILIANSQFTSCTLAVQGSFVDAASLNNLTVTTAIDNFVTNGFLFNDCRSITAANCQISSVFDAITLTSVQGFYLNGGLLNQNYGRAIYATHTAVFMRNGATISDHLGPYPIEIYGEFVTDRYTAMLSIGDLGCGNIRNCGSNGVTDALVSGVDFILNVDAIQHAYNRANPADPDIIPQPYVVYPNRFDGNYSVPKFFKICYSSTGVYPEKIFLNGNYWGPTGYNQFYPNANKFSFKQNANCYGASIPYELCQFVPSTAIANSNSCQSWSNFVVCRLGGASNGSGKPEETGPPDFKECPALVHKPDLKTIHESFKEANVEFIVEDNIQTRSSFKELADLKLSKNSAGEIIICELNDPSCGNNGGGGGGGNPGEKISYPCAQLVMVAKVLYEPMQIQQRLANPENTQPEIANRELLPSSVFRLPSSISIYPNPNNGTMAIDYSLPQGANGKFVIFDVTGRKISEYKLLPENKNFTVAESKLGAGIFYYQFMVDDNPVKTGKLTILK